MRWQDEFWPRRTSQIAANAVVTVFLQKLADEPANFACGACVQLFTQLNEGIALFFVEAQNELTVLFFALFVVFLSHTNLAP